MQTASFRTWTQVAELISYDHSRYAKVSSLGANSQCSIPFYVVSNFEWIWIRVTVINYFNASLHKIVASHPYAGESEIDRLVSADHPPGITSFVGLSSLIGARG